MLPEMRRLGTALLAALLTVSGVLVFAATPAAADEHDVADDAPNDAVDSSDAGADTLQETDDVS